LEVARCFEPGTAWKCVPCVSLDLGAMLASVYRRLGGNMMAISQHRLVLAAAIVIGTGFTTDTWAADTTWMSAKILESGTSQNCGYKYPDYRIEIKGNSFKSVPVEGDSTEASTTTLNIKSLSPDGSGKITVTSKAGKPWTYEFAAGNGPRRIRYGNEFGSCRYAWVPK